MYIFYISLFLLNFSHCQANFLVATELIENYEKKYYCLTNSSSALTWINDDATTVQQGSHLIPNVQRNNIKLNITATQPNEFIQNSLEGEVNEVILDKRWEGLKVYTTMHVRADSNILHFIPVISNLRNDFIIPLSIRAKEGHILLCDGEQVSTSNCYWILLQAFDGKTIAIRKCKRNTIPLTDNTSIPNNCAKFRNKTMHDNKYLTEDSWSHFKLQKKGNVLALFWITKEKEDIVIAFRDNITDMINVSHMIVHSKKKIGFWKIHETTYTYTTKKISESNPIFTELDVVDGSTCISMFVSMCTSCSITLTLRTTLPTSRIKRTIRNQKSGWNQIKFFKNNLAGHKAKLIISTENNNYDIKSFWAIDTSIRACSRKEFRVLTAPEPFKCQLLSEDSEIISFSEINFKDECIENSNKSFCVPHGWFPKRCDDEICAKLQSGAQCSFQNNCEVKTFTGPTSEPDTSVAFIAIASVLLIILIILIIIIVSRYIWGPDYASAGDDLSITETGTKGRSNLATNRNNITSCRINLAELEEYVKESLADGKLESEFEFLSLFPSKPSRYGLMKYNTSKNRYANLIAYDHSRVVLEKIEGDSYSDYINANYIDGYMLPKAYIATQGPKKNTLHDFWRMIWQENVKNIAMIANLVEDGAEKVTKYWPEINQSHEFGDITVQSVASKVYATYEHRMFNITRKDETRKVDQFHFKTWPDHGVPLYAQSLVPFLQRLQKIPLSSDSPVVIHCSAGVGRTGTIILCDISLRMASKEGSVDFLRYIRKIREQRPNMVTSSVQYKLAHLVVLECLFGVQTSVSCETIEDSVQHLIDTGKVAVQMKYLETTAWKDLAIREDSQLHTLKIIVEKNRFPDITPEMQSCVSLPQYPRSDAKSMYINAVKVDDFQSPGRFIVTPQPMPNTVGDFWRLVAEENISVIVSLNEINLENTTSCHFWPDKANPNLAPVDYLNLKHESTISLQCYDLISIHLHTGNSENYKTVEILSFKNWAPGDNCPPKIEDFLTFWEDSYAKSRNAKPVIVTCFDGAKACGVYVALSFIIEKMRMEQLCDVCQAVRTVRHSRKQFVREEEQFVFLYQAAVKYIIGFQSYSNFN